MPQESWTEICAPKEDVLCAANSQFFRTFTMVLAHEARLTDSQRLVLKGLYSTTRLNNPSDSHMKMMQLITQSKVGFA